MKTIEVKVPEGKDAKWVNGVLTLVDEQPKDITEKIKSFEDACKWCKENNHYESIFDYETLNTAYIEPQNIPSDILAYLKLRIITCALNEGWKPTFEDNESRNDVDSKSDDISASCKSSFFNYLESSKLLFKSKHLAEYSAAQFKDIYMDFATKERSKI